MSVSLAYWLTNNRELLLQRWMAPQQAPPHDGNGKAGAVVAHPDERHVLLGSIYDGMICAAGGDHAPLDECLRLLRALRTTPGEDELASQISLLFQLRRAARAVLDGSATRELRDELDQLIEDAVLRLTSHWTASANTLTQKLHQAEIFAASLAESAEQADRVAVQIAHLNEIARYLTESLNPARQLAVVGDKLAEVLEVAHVAIWLHEGDQLRLMGSWGEPALDTSLRLAADAEGDLVARAFRAGTLICDSAPDAQAQGSWYRPGCGVLAAPLMTQERVTGVIALQDPQPELRLDSSQQSFVSSVASHAAIAIENARLYEEVRSFNAILEQRIAERTRELQRERDILETLYAIALEVGSTLDRDTLLANSLGALARLIGVDHGTILLIEPDTGHLVDYAMLDQKNASGFRRFPVGQGIVGWVAQHKKATLVPDVNRDPRWVPLPNGDVERKQGGALIAAPLIAHGELLGVLLLSHHKTGYFREEHLRLLSASAGQIAIGIHNAMLYEEIEQQLMHRGEMLRRQEQVASQSTAILQSLSDGVLVCNEDGAVLTANPAVERILGRPIEELVVWNLPELLRRLLGRRSDEAPVEELLTQPWDERHEPRTFATTFQIGTRVVSLTLGPVITSKDELMGAVAVFRDITREVESDRLKTEFIGTVSHELRTPMTSIKGFTQLLAMGGVGPVNETQKEFLNIIQTNAGRMIAIINDLLDITKIETGSVELQLRPLHLAEALSRVVAELQALVREREQELSIQLPPGLPLVQADAQRLDQILANLLSNAVRYTPRGGAIALEAREASADVVPKRLQEGLRLDTRYILIEVRDTGVGIAPEEQERIFERFYRTENPLKVEAGGTGLGLALVRPLIALHGGRIWVRSIPGEGSSFSFVLPVA